MPTSRSKPRPPILSSTCLHSLPRHRQAADRDRKLGEILVELGHVTRAELESGKPDPAAAKAAPPLTAGKVAAVLQRGGPVERKIDAPPRFAIGQKLRSTTASPTGHTRLPLYARGRMGEVVLHHGAHVFPDANAHGLGECPQHLYAVRFTARELWGPNASPRDSVTLDLWESYLEPL